MIENNGTLDAYDKYADIEAVLFLIRDVDHYFKVWKEDVGREILEKVGSNTGFRLMSLAFRGARYVTSKKKIESFMILKVSKYECLTLLFMLMHCKCLVLAIYQWPLPSCTALQQRTVDAQENPLTENWNSAFYYEVYPRQENFSRR